MASGAVHLVPHRDLRPHRFGLDCPCLPQAVAGPGGMPLIRHQSWDCREYMEEGLPVWHEGRIGGQIPS